MAIPVIGGTSGIKTARSATFRRVISRDGEYMPGGVIVQGSKWYDGGNTGYERVVRAGTIGKLSSGKIVPAVFGPFTVDYVSGATTMTVSAATALAIFQAIGASGTIYSLGGAAAPTTLALVLATAVVYSAINTSTGVLTITDIGANRAAAGSLLVSFQPALLGGTGGLAAPNVGLGLFDRAEGVRVTDADGTSQDVDLGEFAVGGFVADPANEIPNFPSNAFTAEVLTHNLRLACPRLQLATQW